MPDRPLNRICYVEDDEDIQRIVRMSLERVGKMTVEVVGDPTKAIEAMTEFRPDLVMLDWMMPVMDGPTLFRQMQLRPETKALPVVFITAKASQRDLDELMQDGRRRHHLQAFLAEGPARPAARHLGEAAVAALGLRCPSVVSAVMSSFGVPSW